MYEPEASSTIASILARFHILEMPFVKEPRWLFDTILRYMNQIETLEFDDEKKVKFDRLMLYNFK